MTGIVGVLIVLPDHLKLLMWILHKFACLKKKSGALWMFS